MSAELSHRNEQGQAVMVDVGPKPESQRLAIAEASVRMSQAALDAVARHDGPKGDPVQVARIAGIIAAKRTSELIPMCHPLRLTRIDVAVAVESWGVRFEVTVEAMDRTGVEMEALTGASVAALTLYDMLKAVDKAMVIGDVRVLEKRGGRSGHHSVSR